MRDVTVDLVPGGASAVTVTVAAGVTTLILLGRFLEARAKRRAGAALRHRGAAATTSLPRVQEQEREEPEHMAA